MFYCEHSFLAQIEKFDCRKLFLWIEHVDSMGLREFVPARLYYEVWFNEPNWKGLVEWLERVYRLDPRSGIRHRLNGRIWKDPRKNAFMRCLRL